MTEETKPDVPAELPGCALCRAERDSARRTLRSIAKMLGWDHTPPQDVLERSISALKARAEARALPVRPIITTCGKCGRKTWPVETPTGSYAVCGWCDVPILRAAPLPPAWVLIGPAEQQGQGSMWACTKCGAAIQRHEYPEPEAECEFCAPLPPVPAEHTSKEALKRAWKLLGWHDADVDRLLTALQTVGV